MFGIRLGLPPGVGLRGLGVGHTPSGVESARDCAFSVRHPQLPVRGKKEHAQSDTAQGYTAHVHVTPVHPTHVCTSVTRHVALNTNTARRECESATRVTLTTTRVLLPSALNACHQPPRPTSQRSSVCQESARDCAFSVRHPQLPVRGQKEHAQSDTAQGYTAHVHVIPVHPTHVCTSCTHSLTQSATCSTRNKRAVSTCHARVATFHQTQFCYSHEVSRWFEEHLGSEVVFWFDVAHVHDHSLLPVPLRSQSG